MVAFEITIVLLLGAVIALAFSHRIRQPTEVILLLGSLLISFLPLPRVQLAPEVVFSIFLPPILFAAAYFTPWKEFLRNLRPIVLLAFGLVLLTMVGIAHAVHFLIPEMPWPQAYLLGAILAPPDASAAVALVRQFRLPRRLITVIEGESLINDATALTCYRFALGALATGGFELSEAAPAFLLVAVGGALVGLAIGLVAVRLLRLLQHTDAEVLTTLLTPFFCYSIAEHLHLSGVLSTVACGILFGSLLPNTSTSHARIAAKTTWDIFLFAINALVFTFIGLQLPLVVEHLSTPDLFKLTVFALILFVFLVVLRFIWVFPAAYIPRLLSPSLRARDPIPSWQALTVLSWTGMRGIVSLAGALAIPVSFGEGVDTAFRDETIFLAYSVTLLSLLIPSFTLPWLLKRLNIPFVDEKQRDESHARLKMIEAVIERLEQWPAEHGTSRERIQHFLENYQRLHGTLRPNLAENPYTELNPQGETTKSLVVDLLRIEREALVRLRKEGAIHDEVFHHLAQELDFEELRFQESARGNLLLSA